MYRKIGISNRFWLMVKFALIIAFGLYAGISGSAWPSQTWAYIGLWMFAIAASIIWDLRKQK